MVYKEQLKWDDDWGFHQWYPKIEDLEWTIHLLTWDDDWGTHILGQPPNENGYAKNNYDNVGKTMS
jgi:hypothetical protein